MWRPSTSPTSPEPIQGSVVRWCWVATLTQGVSHVTTQLVMLREMLAVYSGNELVVSVLLASWLLLMGLGAALARWGNVGQTWDLRLILAQIGLAVLPLASVSALRTLRNRVFARGVELGLGDTLLSSIALLLPYCVVAGYSLGAMARRVEQLNPDASRRGSVYLADGIGDVLGGALFALVLLRFGNHFLTLIGVGALGALGAALLAWAFRQPILIGVGGATALALGTLGMTVDLDRATLESLYPGRRIVAHQSSRYGDLVVTESAGQYDFLANGVPVGSSDDGEHAEEVVHFAMLQRPRAQRVLLVGGSASGVAEEILRYPVTSVEGVDLDPALLELAQRYVRRRADSRIHWREGDGRAFVRQTEARYDVVIVDLPDPTTLQLGRYYTREFFREVGRVLTPGGVLGLSLGRYANTVSPKLHRALAITCETLRSEFAQVELVPTGRVRVLASQGELTLDVRDRLTESGIRTRWLTPSVLQTLLEPDRVAELRQVARAPAPVNRDFAPVLTTATLVHWLDRFEAGPIPWMVGAVGSLLVVVLALGRVPLAVATLGFAASGLEVLLLVGLGIAQGALYGEAVRLVTAFLLGSTLGAWATRTGQSGRLALQRSGFLMAALALACPLALGWATAFDAPGWAVTLLFPLLAALAGILAGSAFVFGCRSDAGGTPPTLARLYGADLGGAALGALVSGTVLLPYAGAWGVGATLAGVCLLGALGLGGFGRVGRSPV
jgi:spermidine synthase